MRALAVVVPTLNEEAHVGALLRQLLANAPASLRELFVADGGSTDRTREIVEEIAREDGRVRLLDNPRRLQAAGCNLAAREAAPEVETLVRIDAHAGYPDDYVARLERVLSETGAASVVVRLRTVGESCFQEAVAAAGNSRLGTGGSAHRIGGEGRWIDHGHHAAFRRAAFLEVGGYDESFGANEDAELDIRLNAAGHRIWFCPELEVDYWPRSTPLALMRQYFRYGVGRARTSLKWRQKLKARQLAAPAIVLACAGGALLGLAAPIFWVVPAGYVAAALVYGLALGVASGRPCAAASGACAVIMHLSWGAGFLWTRARPPRAFGSAGNELGVAGAR